MTIAAQRWTDWIAALEGMLAEADLNHEHMFAIHVNQAMETAEKRLAASISEPKPDQLPSAEAG